MTSEIWAACASTARPIALDGTVQRLVESQEQVATNSLVRTLAEQALRLVEIEWEQLPFVLDPLEAMKPGAPIRRIQIYRRYTSGSMRNPTRS